MTSGLKKMSSEFKGTQWNSTELKRIHRMIKGTQMGLKLAQGGKRGLEAVQMGSKGLRGLMESQGVSKELK